MAAGTQKQIDQYRRANAIRQLRMIQALARDDLFTAQEQRELIRITNNALRRLKARTWAEHHNRFCEGLSPREDP